MQFANPSLVWVVAALVAIFFAAVTLNRLSPEVRGQKKRRRNYGRVISRARRPVVMLNVNTRRG